MPQGSYFIRILISKTRLHARQSKTGPHLSRTDKDTWRSNSRNKIAIISGKNTSYCCRPFSGLDGISSIQMERLMEFERRVLA